MIVYKRKHGETQPVGIECEAFSHPNRDADGETICYNTHFATIDESFENMITDYEAGISLGTREVIRLRAQLAVAEKTIVDEQILLCETRRNYEDWKQANTAPSLAPDGGHPDGKE